MDFGFLVPISFFGMIVWLVKIISDNKIRSKAIENNNVKESLKYLWQKAYANKPLQNMKWAIIFIITGLVILAGNILSFKEPIIFATCLFMVGIFLLIYSLIEKKQKNIVG